MVEYKASDEKIHGGEASGKGYGCDKLTGTCVMNCKPSNLDRITTINRNIEYTIKEFSCLKYIINRNCEINALTGD